MLDSCFKSVFKVLRGDAHAQARERGRGAPRDPSRAARSGRQLQGRQGVRRPVRDRAVGQDVLRSLSPSQQVVRIVRDEMLALFGDTEGGLRRSRKRPRVILLLGLQGSGKTTTAASWRSGWSRAAAPLLVSTDVQRPAAIQQLSVLAQKAGLRGCTTRPGRWIRSRARGRARRSDEPRVRRRHRRLGGPPAHRRRADDRARGDRGHDAAVGLLYVADAMTGQDAIKSAGEFNRRLASPASS